ncbi:polyprenyl synthetase family protein [Flavobacteriaceae bacterium]|nr:polyprenyl synthetase family protein [Flavobacteriaceae bacterium]MDA9338902.1 polyprenyl synthetase family protein [Flavobacteriaceae bacterium]MDB4113427.1 polyprenyl synthetase family protein [Flavobacteriaceae bacterium]
MLLIKLYADLINKSLKELSFSKTPESLYDPIKYILEIGGKRIRPYLVLMSTSVFGADPKLSLNAALSVECFHNFTLMHDDIMDSAPLRRGNETVHLKWDINQSILSGDALLIYSYKLLEDYNPIVFKKLNTVLNTTALQVCEGQQFDIDFEKNPEVTFENYINMIKLKTAVLVGASLQMGAIIAEANENDLQKIYDFGVNLGIAFQLQDDYLDTFGEESLVGKSIGGDILENKKTALFHLCLLNANKDQSKSLKTLYSQKNSIDKVAKVTQIFKTTKADIDNLKLVENYTNLALNSLNHLSISNEKKDELIEFSNSLLDRKL